MGCSICREDDSSLENEIIRSENKLNYYKVNVTLFVDTLVQSSKGNEISLEQMNTIGRKYNLINTSDQDVIEFYNEMKDGNHYNLRKLATVAVLLSRSSAKQKATALFKAWTINQGGKLDKNTGAELINELFTLSDQILPSMYSENRARLDEDKKIMSKATHESENLLNSLFGNSLKVKQDDFVAWFTETERTKWLSSSGVRAELRRLGQNKNKEETERGAGKKLIKA
jgi:hypothetical protein